MVQFHLVQLLVWGSRRYSVSRHFLHRFCSPTPDCCDGVFWSTGCYLKPASGKLLSLCVLSHNFSIPSLAVRVVGVLGQDHQGESLSFILYHFLWSSFSIPQFRVGKDWPSWWPFSWQNFIFFSIYASVRRVGIGGPKFSTLICSLTVLYLFWNKDIILKY